MDRREGAWSAARTAGGVYNVKGLIRRAAVAIGFGICAYFAGLAELPFGARPFGVALLAASGKETVFVYIGLIISAFVGLEVDEAIIYFAVYSALLLLRIFSWVFVEVRGKNRTDGALKSLYNGVFREKVGLRTINSSVFGLSLGAAILFSGGLLYYDLFGLLILTLLSPATTFLLCGYIDGRGKSVEENSKAGIFYILGFLALCSITVFGAREINVYGVSVSVAFALMVTFYVTCRYGVGYGSMGGLIIGACYSPLLSPIFVISALCMGILSRFSVALACFTAFFASCTWAFYVQGMSALLGAFGGILSASLLYSVIYKSFLSEGDKVKEEKTRTAEKDLGTLIKCAVLPESALDSIKLYEMNARTSAISDGLYKLSRFFEDLKIDGNSFYDANKCAEKYNDAFLDDVSAPEYKALSALLAKAMESEENEYSVNRELSLKLCRVLTDLKLDICGVLVYGVRKKTILIKGKNRDALSENAAFIAESLAPLLPFAIDIEAIDVRRNGEKGGLMLVFERKKSSASVVRRRVTASGEDVCGDSVSIFKNKDDRFFALLSDGMGTGSAASLVSGISVGFLSNMLSSGGLNEELVDMLNGFLCTRFQKNMSECSATLDLFELDMMNGHALVYKCGAAPSYIYRRGRLFKLRSESMPIGILNDVDLKKYELDLSRGDVMIMVSDGVTGEGEECPWLFDLLAQNLPNRSLERIAELIIKYATAKGSADDITVLLVRVE